MTEKKKRPGNDKSSLESKTTKKQRGNPDKLVSLADRTPEERAEIARQGGKASGEAKREARRWRDFYAGVIADTYLTKDEKGEVINQSFDDISKKAISKIIEKADATTIALWKEMRVTQDGDTLEINANVQAVNVTEGMSHEEKVRLAKEWAKKNL